MKRIRATFKDGKAEVKTFGFQGSACLDATRDLEKALGKVTGDIKTAEFRQTAEVEADAVNRR